MKSTDLEKEQQGSPQVDIPSYLNQIKGAGYHHAKRLFVSGEIDELTSRLTPDHVQMLVLSVGKAFKKSPESKDIGEKAWMSFLIRFRKAVFLAIRFDTETSSENIPTRTFEFGRVTITVPLDVASASGIPEKAPLLTILLLLDDYLDVLRFCLKVQRQKLAPARKAKLEEECAKNLTMFSQLKQSSFQTVAESYGFGLQFSGGSLLRQRSKICKMQDLPRIISTLEKTQSQLRQLILAHWPELG